jgi:hypothetical protein
MRTSRCGIAVIAAGALAAALATAGAASVNLGSGASGVSLQVDAAGEAFVSFHADGQTQSLLVPESGELSHAAGPAGVDVSRAQATAGLPGALLVRRTPDGRLWALQLLPTTGGAPQLDLSRWSGAPTRLTLELVAGRLIGRASFGGQAVSGHTFTPAGKRPRIYVYLDCFDCGGRRGWSPMLGVAPHGDGSFAVLVRPGWKGSRYRATMAGPNRGTTLAPDAQVVISA